MIHSNLAIFCQSVCLGTALYWTIAWINQLVDYAVCVSKGQPKSIVKDQVYLPVFFWALFYLLTHMVNF